MRSPRVPLVLLRGLPGTGKPHALRVIAAKKGLTPCLLNGSKLTEDSYSAPKLWADALKQISGLENAAIFIDEAEVMFGSRSEGNQTIAEIETCTNINFRTQHYTD